MPTKPPKRTTGSRLWCGPYDDGPEGGITCTMLRRFEICPHRFWLRYAAGMEDLDEFNHKMEFGNLFHAGLEADQKVEKQAIFDYAALLNRRFPKDHGDILYWASWAAVLLPIYRAFWQPHDRDRKYTLYEHVFAEQYQLPDGRSVLLRGKLDAVFEQLKSGLRSTVLQENKTKGDVDEYFLLKTLDFEQQTGVYMLALRQMHTTSQQWVLYNVIRRPLSGTSNPKRRQKEAAAAFINRCVYEYDGTARGYPITANLEHWFKRWDVKLEDLSAFESEYLIPALTRLCDWYDSLPDGLGDPFQSKLHYRRPWGYFDPASHVRGEFFEHLTSGIRMPRAETCFPELKR